MNRELLYSTMTGEIDEERFYLNYGGVVQNEFVAGSFCDTAYEKIFSANQRLCNRLGVQTDKDLEEIITNMFAISKHLALKMYDYGVYFSSPSSSQA